MGPTRTTTRGQTLTRGVEDKAADILALARSLVHENDATLGRSKSTLRKTMRKTQTQRAATTSPTSRPGGRRPLPPQPAALLLLWLCCILVRGGD